MPAYRFRGIGNVNARELGRRVEVDAPSPFPGHLQQARFIGLEVDAGHRTDVRRLPAAGRQRLADGLADGRRRRAAIAAETKCKRKLQRVFRARRPGDYWPDVETIDRVVGVYRSLR